MRQVRSPTSKVRSGSTAIFSVALAFGLLAAPVLSHGQQSAKVYRVGLLEGGQAPTERTPQGCPVKGGPVWQALVAGLRDHGYIPGQNLVIECRWTEGRVERASALAAELVTLKVDLILANWTANVRAAKQATSTIPIVMSGVIEPVQRGLVASLARPGGNVTGLTDTVGVAILGKQLQLLKETVPRSSRVAVLYHPGRGGPGSDLFLFLKEEHEATAQAMGLTLQFYPIRDPDEFVGIFSAMTKARAEALYVMPAPLFSTRLQQIVDLALQSRLPAMMEEREFVQAGGLMSYGANIPAIRRRVGFYVDKIFHGANPGDLPVEQPTKFDLLINLKTAMALELTIPRTLLIQADEVIR